MWLRYISEIRKIVPLLSTGRCIVGPRNGRLWSQTQIAVHVNVIDNKLSGRTQCHRAAGVEGGTVTPYALLQHAHRQRRLLLFFTHVPLSALQLSAGRSPSICVACGPRRISQGGGGSLFIVSVQHLILFGFTLYKVTTNVISNKVRLLRQIKPTITISPSRDDRQWRIRSK